MEAIRELKELGLNDNEIKVYLACLSMGSSKVHDIAKESEMIRTTTYGLLTSLIRKGLVSTVKKDNILFFQAAQPKELLNMLDQKKEKITSIIPQLEKLKTATLKPYEVEFFEGKGGVKTIVNDIISKPNEIVKMVSEGKKWLDFSESFTTVYYRKKKEMNVRTKTIFSDTEEEREVAKNRKIKNSEIRFIKGMEIKGTCYIYHNKVSFVTYNKDNPRGFIVKDEDFNRIQNFLFDSLWKTANKP